jgi:hypothetical protein
VNPKESPDAEEIIQGPLNIALSAIGVDGFVKRGQKLRKLRFFDGSEDFGMEMPLMAFKSLQKMAMTGLVYRIEQSVADFARQRRDLMSLARCFAVATVYRQFEKRLWEIIAKNELLVQWNRSHPRLLINAEVNSQSPAMQTLLAKAAEGILAAKQEVLKVVQASIMKGQRTLPDEKRALTLLAIRYLNAVDPAVWLLLATATDPMARDAMLAELQKLLLVYVGRSELPEYLALMMAEMAVIVGKVGCADDGEEGAACGSLVYVSYELGSVKKSQEERAKVRIQIGNEANDFTDLKSRFDQQGNTRKSLDTFMASGSRREGSLVADAVSGMEGVGTDMGVYYLSCLKDACKKMDISIDSFVNIIPHTKRTLINLVLAV